QADGNFKLPTIELGQVTLKKITAPIRLSRVLTLGESERKRAPAMPWDSRPSIAVLPFVEYGARAADSLIGEGIAEDVVAALASLPDLFVISRNSTLKYRETPLNIQAIRRELGVRYVCSGTARR